LARHQYHQLGALTEKQRIGAYQQNANALPLNSGERSVNFFLCSSGNNQERLPDKAESSRIHHLRVCWKKLAAESGACRSFLAAERCSIWWNETGNFWHELIAYQGVGSGKCPVS
jgi:hypothetical protein